MNKKVICGVLSAAVLFSTSPITALAAEKLPILELTESLDFREVDEDTYGTGWEWDASTLTLTLEDFRYVVREGYMEEGSVIYLPDESSIEVEGDDNLLHTYSYECDAITCEGELEIYGDGKLEIITDSKESSAIFVKEGPLLINDEVEITVESEWGYIIYVKYAKGDGPIISIQDEAKISFKKEDHKKQNILITHKSGIRPTSNWLDYDEVENDKDDDYVDLVAEPVQVVPEIPEVTQPEEPVLNEYQIVIGNPNIIKNGDISYTADVVPYLSNGYTMLPMRALLEVSNPEQQVHWNNGTKSAHTFVNNQLVSIKPGEATYTKALETIELSTPAETVNGRLFVSLRDWMSIMEINGSQLGWDAETKTVTLTY